MKLIIGLGNPDPIYKQTRHNIGFLIIDELAKQLNSPEWKKSSKHKSLISECTDVASPRLLLAKPMTYMNLSGQSVASLVNFYQLDPEEDILICHDDKDMLFGKLRERKEGGSGGHNGLKSIISSLGTENFHRLKYGIGHEDQEIPTDSFVLQNFTAEEELKNPTLIKEAINKVKTWLSI